MWIYGNDNCGTHTCCIICVWFLFFMFRCLHSVVTSFNYSIACFMGQRIQCIGCATGWTNSLYLTFQTTPYHLLEGYKGLFSPALNQRCLEAGHSPPSYAVVKSPMPSSHAQGQVYLYLFAMGETRSVAQRKGPTEIKAFEKKCVLKRMLCQRGRKWKEAGGNCIMRIFGYS